MTMANLSQIYDWFMTGKKPTQAQFWASWGSFWNKEETIPQSAVSNLATTLNAKAEKAQFDAHKTAADAHQALFDLKQSLTDKGAQGGYAPLDEFTKLAAEYLNIVDDLVTGGSTALASAETVKTLKGQIDAINLILTSDDVNLDTVQELVNAIKEVETSLETILVNDLTTGGTTKALTAEMGKSLKALIDALTTTVNGKLSNLVRTVKTITSANLATQDVAGFVTYINALNPVLVVAANETVEYQLSDTGKIFKLLLSNRSFGTGQPAITAANVEDITLWMQKDLRLNNYTSTRNDGANPTNKVLGVDTSGNLKLYSLAAIPAAYLESVTPNFFTPSQRVTNISVKGSFFTPFMTVTISGGTLHGWFFLSDNEIILDITVSSTSGFYSLTLDNGITKTYTGAIQVNSGTVFNPTASDYQNIAFVDVSAGTYIKQTKYVNSDWDRTVKATLNKTLIVSDNNEIQFSFIESPYGSGNIGFSFAIVDASDSITERINGTNSAGVEYYKFNQQNAQFNVSSVKNDWPNKIIQLKVNAGAFSVWINGVSQFASTMTVPNDFKILFYLHRINIKNLKTITY